MLASFSKSLPGLWAIFGLSNLCVISSIAQVITDATEVMIAGGSTEISAFLRNESFFTDRVGSCILYFDTRVESPEIKTLETDTLSVLEIEVFDTPDSAESVSIAIVNFIPKVKGLVTLPSLNFKSEKKRYRSKPLQFMVGEPVKTDRLSVELIAQSEPIYIGQPLRIDMRLHSDFNASAICELQFNPSFFNERGIEVVIPRSQDSEDMQVGFPIGGRRVIARRIQSNNAPETLGEIHLSLFIRIEEAGTYFFPAAKLECALLDKQRGNFGRYAAHFNNSFFETPKSDERYSRAFTYANTLEIEVLQLPRDDGPIPFSGLFEPVEIIAEVEPLQMKIGELAQTHFLIASDAPHGFLDLPSIASQRGLRSRFLMENEYLKQWHHQGTLLSARFRPLTTAIDAFPSLSFKTFDPKNGTYLLRKTRATPLEILPYDNKTFVPVGTFPEATVSLTSNGEGIWHNRNPSLMNELLNTLYSGVQSWFWLLILLGPLLFGAALPWAIDARRKSRDPRYLEKKEAYSRFKAAPARSQEKWQAFLTLLSVVFEHKNSAWTRNDSERALGTLKVNTSDIHSITEIHKTLDAREYGNEQIDKDMGDFESVAKRIAKIAIKASFSLVLVFYFLDSPRANANEWEDANQLFKEAQNAQPGSEQQSALYFEAALKFQAAAAGNIHTDAAWINAGNAWFQSGEIGRAIASYLEAQNLRPFDEQLLDSLKAARALTQNSINADQSLLQKISKQWVKVAIVLINFLYWSLLLVAIRHPKRNTYLAAGGAGVLLFFASILLIQKTLTSNVSGVVIAETVIAKKGPSYAYANAFNEPLHNGLEFTLTDSDSGWGFIQLTDARMCWVPLSQIQLIAE